MKKILLLLVFLGHPAFVSADNPQERYRIVDIDSESLVMTIKLDLFTGRTWMLRIVKDQGKPIRFAYWKPISNESDALYNAEIEKLRLELENDEQQPKKETNQP